MLHIELPAQERVWAPLAVDAVSVFVATTGRNAGRLLVFTHNGKELTNLPLDSLPIAISGNDGRLLIGDASGRTTLFGRNIVPPRSDARYGVQVLVTRWTEL